MTERLAYRLNQAPPARQQKRSMQGNGGRMKFHYLRVFSYTKCLNAFRSVPGCHSYLRLSTSNTNC